MLRYSVTQDYKALDQIGEGNYASVVRTDCGKYAIKRTIEKDLNIHLIKEYMILQAVKSVGIIQMRGFYCNYNLGKWDLAICMPLYSMTLRDFYKSNCKKPTYPAQVSRLMNTICHGVYALHRVGILHLDIKPDNILINPETMDVRLIDFGISQYIGCITHKQFWKDVVTLWYRPPEIINSQPFDHKADVWSVGCILGELIYGEPLFTGDRTVQIKANHETRTYKKWKPIEGLEQLASILEGLLISNPDERKSISWLLGKLGYKVQSITAANKDWMQRNCIVKPRIQDSERKIRLDYIINTMFYNKDKLETIINAIAWMDLFKVHSDNNRSWMAAVDNLQENPFSEIHDWAGTLVKHELIQFERSVVECLDRMRFIPIISNFTGGSPVELAMCLIVMYSCDYVTISPALLGKAIKKLVSNKSGEPDAVMTFVMSCLENTSKDCPVLDIVEDIASFI